MNFNNSILNFLNEHSLLQNNLEYTIEHILKYTIMYKRNDIANFILDNFNIDLDCNVNDLYKLIHYVCYYDNIFLLDKLIKKNININTTNKYNDTALTICSKDDKYEFVNILLENGADINHINEFGNTLMHYACMNNSVCVLNLGLKYKPNLNIKNTYGFTPLDICISNSFKHSMIDKLLNNNADPFNINYDNKLVYFGLKNNNTNINRKIKNKMFDKLLHDIKIFDTLHINIELNIIRNILDYLI